MQKVKKYKTLAQSSANIGSTENIVNYNLNKTEFNLLINNNK